MNYKQLVCRHVWRDVSEEPIRTVKEPALPIGSVPFFCTYQIYAVRSECAKCLKHRIQERRVIVI